MTVKPIAFAAFCTSTARSGSSYAFCVVSWVFSFLPAASFFASAMFCFRCGTDFGNAACDGAIGESLPSTPRPPNSVFRIDGRLSE